NFASNGNSSNAKVFAAAVIALHEHADNVATSLRGERTRRRADATFITVANHAGTAADAAFLNGAGLCGIDGLKNVLGLHVEAVDVVEPAVPGFGDHGKRPPIAGRIGLAVGHAPLNDGIADNSHAVRVGDHH